MYNSEFNIQNPIAVTNLHGKSLGTYTNLGLSHVLLNTDFISFSEFLEEILSKYNKNNSTSERIDVFLDSGILSRWNLFFDSFTVSLYRGGFELDKNFTSNYIYTEISGDRNFWIDLYYSKDTYDTDKVFKDILREMNNFYNRDYKKYLHEVE